MTSMDRSSRQKINEATEVLNHTIDQLNLIDIYRTLHLKKTQNTHSSQACMEHSLGTDHILGHKISLNKLKRTEIISSIFSGHNVMKLEINHRKKKGGKMNTWRLNNMLLKNQWANDEIKEEIGKYLKTNKNENTTLQKSTGCNKSSS